MADQYMGIYEEDDRGTPPAAPTVHFLPVRSLRPVFDPTDESRKEFRGAATALGDTADSVVRRSSSWSHSLVCGWYPIAAVGLLLKHALGFSGTRATVDTTAKKGILFPVVMPYGAGAALGNKAVALVPNTDEGGITLSRVFGGGRARSLTIAIKQPDDVSLTFELGGAGDWVGAEDEALPGFAEPSIPPFLSVQAACYIGSGATRTGAAPNFTAIAPGGMTPFAPDELNIKITPGLEDAAILNGVAGPSHTRRNSQVLVEFDFTLDYADPSSGFKSADEFKKVFQAPNTTGLLVVLDLGQLAGAASENYQAVIDIPIALLKGENPADDPEGKTTQVKFSGTAKIDRTIGYPVALLTTDQVSAN